MKSSTVKFISFFFTSFLMMSVLTENSLASPRISEIENLRIVTVVKNGEYRIDASFELGYPFYKCRDVIEGFNLYPGWLFNGVNELGKSRLARLTQKNFHFVARSSRESLVFDYDVKVLFFHFRGNLDIVLSKSLFRNRVEGKINGVLEKPDKYVKFFRGELYFKKSTDGKTSVACSFFIRPASLAYKVIPPETLKRVVLSRLGKICENLNKEVFIRSSSENI